MVFPTSSILVLASDDGQNWSPVHRFSVPRRDMRDPHFLLFGDKLFVYTGTWYCGAAAPKFARLERAPGLRRLDARRPAVGRPSDARRNLRPLRLAGRGPRRQGVLVRAKEASLRALRRARADERRIGAVGKQRRARVFQSRTVSGAGRRRDGVSVRARRIDPGGGPRRRPDECRALPRGGPVPRVAAKRPGTPDRRAARGAGKGTRWSAGGAGSARRRTALYWLADGALHEFAVLPSGGDNSYPGFVPLEGNRALISYYSSHERDAAGRPITAIYLAELKLNE